MEKGRIELTDPNFKPHGLTDAREIIREAILELPHEQFIIASGEISDMKAREIEWYQSLLADLKAGNIEVAIEGVEAAIEVLKR